MRLLHLTLLGLVLTAHPASAQLSRDCPDCPAMIELPSGAAMATTLVTRDMFSVFAEETQFPEQPDCVLRTDKRFQKTDGANWQNPGFEQAGDHPVVCVTWLDATAYADWLSETTGRLYRLPTWEESVEATAAGSETAFWWGDDFANVCENANVADAAYREIFPEDPRNILECSDGHAHTAPVTAFPANAWGIHDAAGNVWQWTNSCVGGDCSNAIFRGGAWTVPNPKHLRSDGQWADRVRLRNNAIGFRVMRDPD
ncbi:MAG: SUMF1/EgtB/PvdO family nonheme iron enzyme [Pseudomonadota bacterium]